MMLAIGFRFPAAESSEATLRYVPIQALEGDAANKNVILDWPESDKTPIQVDMSSLNVDNQGLPCMSLYKYLVTLEKSKRVTQYEISYSECTRKTGGNEDGFNVKVKEGGGQMYQTMTDGSKALSCKNFFHDCAKAARESNVLAVIFRFRYDRVHAVSKVQKPYIFTGMAVELEPGVPVCIC